MGDAGLSRRESHWNQEPEGCGVLNVLWRGTTNRAFQP